jgi:hypothetical protein
MSEELSIDEAVAMMDGTAPEAVEEVVEHVESEQVETAEATEGQEESEQVDEQEESSEQPQQPDYTTKVKFKANGQEVEKSIQELIADAQLASNYNQKMQELAQQRKAFETANQQQQQSQQPDPLKQFEDLNNEVTARAMKMLGITDPEEFVPDAMGIIGNKVHYAAYQKALLDVQQEQQSANYQAQQERIVEETYYSTVNSFTAEPDFAEVNKFAVDTLFQLPQKGAEGVQEFQKLYGIYQKTQLREQHWQETQQCGHSNVKLLPFTPAEIKELEKFYNSCRSEYHAKQTKAKVKEQVPKSIPIKPTVKMESTGNNDPQPSRKVDYKKVREMDLDDIAKLL